MGNCCLPIRFRRTPSAVNPKNVTLLLLGLDNAGKTTIVKRLAGEPIDSVVPTVGFSVVLLRQKGCHVSIYDLGGGAQIRDIWPRYYADAHGVIFVADAQDTERMEECRQVLEALLLNEQISGKPVLLLANKQDLEGALDEIDVVDRLNLERLVNEQKCPTLVELCSALSFSKKLDVGIENGYKWLIRSIIRDYPVLNNRVLRDLAKQEAENKVQVIRKVRQEEEERDGILSFPEDGSSFEPVKIIPEEKKQLNGYISTGKKSHLGIKTISAIPGLIDDGTRQGIRKTHQVHRFIREENASAVKCRSESSANSYSNEFFLFDKFQSDLELLNDVPNHSLKNFLVRPKSSGARLYGARPEKKRTHKRKPLKKVNKTGPSPFTDISNDRNAQRWKSSNPVQKSFDVIKQDNFWYLARKVSVENVNPFLLTNNKEEGGQQKTTAESFEMKAIGGSKSVPNSRRNSMSAARRRRCSMANGKIAEVEGFSASVFLPAKEILLDVTKLSN